MRTKLLAVFSLFVEKQRGPHAFWLQCLLLLLRLIAVPGEAERTRCLLKNARPARASFDRSIFARAHLRRAATAWYLRIHALLHPKQRVDRDYDRAPLVARS